MGRPRRDTALGEGAKGARRRCRPEPAGGQAAPPPAAELRRRARLVPGIARRPAALHAPAAGDRARDRAAARGARGRLRGAPRRPGRLAPFRRALGLRLAERADRQAQPLVPDGVAAEDGPAHARLRQGRRQAVPSRTARRRLDPEAVPVHCTAHDSRPRPRPRARADRRGAASRSRGRGSAPLRARADPPVRRSVAAADRVRGLRLRRRPAPARLAHDRPDARRPGSRARGHAGGRAPARLRLRARRGRRAGGRQPDDRRRAARRSSRTTRAACRCRASGCRSSA